MLNQERLTPTTVEIPLNININENIDLERLRIDPTLDVPEPPVYCSISRCPSMTAGNFSLIIGKAKSGKTFLLVSIIASSVNNGTQLNLITGSLPEDKRNVLYFDTEQSLFHTIRTVKRICSMVGDKNPSNLISYTLRPCTPSQRLEYIERKIYQTAKLGLVAIDGIRDLLTKGINDEEEATTLTSKLLKWTSDLNIHIILILHQNKNDLNARGHIGTELINKAETTLSVAKEKNCNTFVVSCDYSRDIPFDDFGFTIESGLIKASDLPKASQLRGKNPQQISDEEHISKLDLVFKDTKILHRDDLVENISYHFKIGKVKCRDFLNYYVLEKKWITKEKEGNYVNYKYQRATF